MAAAAIGHHKLLGAHKAAGVVLNPVPSPVVLVENTMPAAVIQALEARGHKVRTDLARTAANSILVTPQGFVGAADQRTRGALAAGY